MTIAPCFGDNAEAKQLQISAAVLPAWHIKPCQVSQQRVNSSSTMPQVKVIATKRGTSSCGSNSDSSSSKFMSTDSSILTHSEACA